MIFEYILIYSHITAVRSKELNNFINSYIETVCYLWSEEQRQIEEEKRLSSSIYRHETSELESEQDDHEYKRLFPSFDSDFIDFISSEEKVEMNEDEKMDEKVSKTAILPYYLIYEYFCSILNPKEENLNELIVGFFNSLYEFGEDHRLISHMINLTLKIKENLSKYYLNKDKPFDIYKDSKSSMVIECFSTITLIEQRSNYLLITHENHPTLNEILCVIKRLKSFSIKSSLIKFLYGFDILFDKMNYWQQTFASKSLQTTFDNELNLLTKIIIHFRKYEFNCYEQSLSMIDFNLRKLTIENWFLHLFSIMNSNYDESQENLINLEKNLHEFFQKSTLGDFQIRLEICELLLKYFSKNNKNILILNSIINYYKQFKINFQNEILLKRKLIENNLKKFFQIQQWKDTNYYSLKQSIEKSHQFLFKSIKKYKQLLNESSVNYFSSYSIKLNFILSKTEDFFRLIHLKFNKKLFNLLNYSLINNIKIDTNLVNELSSTIFSMKIQTNDRKQIKQLYNEKRQLITQLFKKLTSIGLSFRKGLLNKQFDLLSTDSFQSYHIDLNKNYGYIQTKNKKFIIDNRSNTLEKFSSFYDKINLNYYEITYQHKQLHLLGQKNKIDPIIYQRIQGFMEHLFKIISQQKILFDTFIKQYENFSKIFSIYSKQNFQYSLSDNNQNNIDQLYYLTICLIERIHSFLLVIRSKPIDSFEQIPILDQLPSYIQLLNSNDFINLAEKFLERLNLLIEKFNSYYDHIIDYHPLLNDIYHIHYEISSTKQQIDSLIEKLFINENLFPNDQFIGQLAKNFLDIYQQFCQINIIKQEKGLN